MYRMLRRVKSEADSSLDDPGWRTGLLRETSLSACVLRVTINQKTNGKLGCKIVKLGLLLLELLCMLQ